MTNVTRGLAIWSPLIVILPALSSASSLVAASHCCFLPLLTTHQS